MNLVWGVRRRAGLVEGIVRHSFSEFSSKIGMAGKGEKRGFGLADPASKKTHTHRFHIS